MLSLHYLKPNTETLHGFFSKDLEPALEINIGDTVIFQTLDAT